MVTMAEVIAEHRYWEDGGSCGCDDMFYDTRRAEKDIWVEHALHVEERLEAAGFGSVEKVRKLATDMAALCPPDDWPESGMMMDAAVADFGRSLLAALDGGA